MATIALAHGWLQNPVVEAPIVGATEEHHLTDDAAALDIDLTPKELSALKDSYARREPTYF